MPTRPLHDVVQVGPPAVARFHHEAEYQLCTLAQKLVEVLLDGSEELLSCGLVVMDWRRG